MAIPPTQSERRVFPGTQDYELTDAVFNKIAQLVKARTGIVLGANKRTMVYGRLVKRLRTLDVPGFEAYLGLLEGPRGETEMVAALNAITTNLTKFFREKHHFDHLAGEGMAVIRARHTQESKPRLRIWSAGCSSGEEPYTIAMTLQGAMADLRQWDAKILATDIDTDMVARGKAGLYPADRIDDLPEAITKKWFTAAEEGKVRVAPALNAMITFKHLNLLGAWPMKGPFDAVFCRNVVIYFDKETQRVLFDRIANLIAPGGFLYIGHSENLWGVCDRFKLVGKTIYRKTH